MKNAELPAMPCEWKDFDSQGVQVVRESYDGLTKREMFAMLAMQGLTAKYGDYSAQIIAEKSVKQADALLAALEITNE